MKFKVIIGSHFEGSKEYKQGEVLKSERPLHKLFPGKFQKLVSEDEEGSEEVPSRSGKAKAKDKTEKSASAEKAKKPAEGEGDEDWDKDKE